MQKIIFNDRYGLTEAVLSGRKTMTRRIIKAPKRINGYDTNGFIVCQDIATHEVTGIYARGYDGGTIDDIEILPKYEIGEVVAVAQGYKNAGINPDSIVSYKEDGTPITAIQSPGWGNKMFTRADLMPHQIRTTGVRVERLQDISDEDCLREGIEKIPNGGGYKPYAFYDISIKGKSKKEGVIYGGYRSYDTPREAFAALIDKVSGRGTWESNPYVFVYEFELVK